MQDIEVSIDLTTAEKAADRAVSLFQKLRSDHDLSRWEFTHHVRIAPYEIPHSHPVLTLNTQFIHDEDAFLALYLHEQIHWGIALNRQTEVDGLIAELGENYPELANSNWGVAKDAYSTYLHIVVNWLELQAVSEFLGEEKARSIAEAMPFYQKIYSTVLDDWDEIEALLRAVNILPFPSASKTIIS